MRQDDTFIYIWYYCFVMADVALKANIRTETGKKTKTLKAQGLIPAIVYGKKFDNLMVSVDAKTFTK